MTKNNPEKAAFSWARAGLTCLGLWAFCHGCDYMLKKQAERLSLFESQPAGIEQKIEQESEPQIPLAPARQKPLEIKYLEQSASDTNYQEQLIRTYKPADLVPQTKQRKIIPIQPSENKENKIPTNYPQRKIKIQNYQTPANPVDQTNPVTPDFIERIINQESKNNPRAVSQKGARGLMQIMESTWHEITKELYGERLSYQKAFDSKINKEAGTAYFLKLDRMLTNSLPRYSSMSVEEQQKYLEAAYNGGINRLLARKGKISNMPRETRKYVKMIDG